MAKAALALDQDHRDLARDPLPQQVRHQAPKRLKICFISETVHAGVGRHVADALCALAERGHDLHLVYSPRRADANLLALVKRNANITCHEIEMPRALGPQDIRAYLKIKACIRKHGPFDIIHGHSSKGGGYARLLRLTEEAAIVYSPHAFVTMSPQGFIKRTLYRLIERTLAGLSDRIICTSLLERDHAGKIGIPDDRLTTISNGAWAAPALMREAIRDELALTDDQVVVGFVGRMEPQKAPERLIAAARALLPEIPNLVFVMIGDGPQRQALELEMESAGLASRVRWLGAVSARHYLPALDVFALCSRYEGFAYVYLEALQAGLPIVTTPVGGAHESVTPEVNGLVVSHSSNDLADALRRLAHDADLRQAMAAASRQRATYFSVPRMVDAMERVYRKVLENRIPREAPQSLEKETYAVPGALQVSS